MADTDTTNADAGAAGAETKSEASPQSISMTTAQLEARLQRSQDAAIKRHEESLRNSGRLLEEDEAQQWAESRKAQREAEEAKLRKSVSQEDYQKLSQEKESLKQQAAARETELTLQLHRTRIDTQMSLALASYHYAEKVRPEHVKRLLQDEKVFGVEDGEVVVLDERGNPRYSDTDSSKLMSVAEYVDRRLQDDLNYFLAPKGVSGSGGTPLRGQSTVRLPHNYADENVYRTLSDEQKEEAAKQQGLRSGGKPGFTFARPKTT